MGFLKQRQRPKQKPRPAHNDLQIGPSGFSSFMTEAYVEDHHARDGSSTSLVSSRPHAQPEEEDPMDESVEDEERRSQEGEI
jgi:hypothetical protein